MIPLQIFNQVSAKLNPAMCLAQWITGNLNGVDFVCLSLSEIAGAFCGEAPAAAGGRAGGRAGAWAAHGCVTRCHPHLCARRTCIRLRLRRVPARRAAVACC